MQLPNWERAVIAPEKLRDYLLNEAHPANGGKAEFFLRLGYRRAEWRYFEADIRQQHVSQDAVEVAGNDYGRKWVIDAVINGPLQSGRIITVWFVPFDDEVPHLVTARPNVRVR